MERYQVASNTFPARKTNFLYHTKNGIIVDSKTMEKLITFFLCSWPDFYTIYNTQL